MRMPEFHTSASEGRWTGTHGGGKTRATAEVVPATPDPGSSREGSTQDFNPLATGVPMATGGSRACTPSSTNHSGSHSVGSLTTIDAAEAPMIPDPPTPTLPPSWRWVPVTQVTAQWPPSWYPTAMPVASVKLAAARHQ